ncbi:AAA family ATPase [Candidatus Bathyarchaeota archaeon]|nr:AAA family ATPase [Candidatus Bathyarchaeota archaeon]
MVSEEDIIKFLREHGAATLEEISSFLKIPKYGPKSAYEILYSLKSRNIVERRGGTWALIEPTQPKANTENRKTASVPEIGLDKLAKTLKETIMEQRTIFETGSQEREVKPRQQKTLVGFKTGTFLDELFFGLDGSPLGGIPSSGQIALIGPLGSGKSLLASQIALKVASDRKTLFVVLDDVWESERSFDLLSRMRIRSAALRVDWSSADRNLCVLNPTDIDDLSVEYERIVSSGGIDLAIIDPLNKIDALGGREEAGWRISSIINLNRVYGVTGIFVVHDSLTYNEKNYRIPGDHPLSIMDCAILMVPIQYLLSRSDVSFSDIKGAERLRLIKIAYCRLCGFEHRSVLVSISRSGVIQPIEIDSP